MFRSIKVEEVLRTDKSSLPSEPTVTILVVEGLWLSLFRLLRYDIYGNEGTQVQVATTDTGISPQLYKGKIPPV